MAKHTFIKLNDGKKYLIVIMKRNFERETCKS